ncbi:hypothetical protein K493DRAFT_320594 [Basidiobolus meristosporus CBS 931.73]|uniref:Zn(2)-C6 fungal-type domain-containing protein n=1 Tax=Basidiobolus meristosporus CBS 931.73 TaxID=1314790 RepID=A0A1Y1X7I9_9FUNG|nr:hypothetical protein K493DRAFT_320594 [Basidiobolus meristosporus CBS 931.73]|eukprot:ORX81705.1 hypothetical protein K493DRAFT_320594 [Basidiobolus meristosporus CBS 931.73]
MTNTDEHKRQRVSRACDHCRRKKVRCDGVQPCCGHCKVLNIECTYLDVTKKRGPPKGYIEAIENRLHRMEHLLGGLAQSDPRVAENIMAELRKIEIDDSTAIIHSQRSNKSTERFRNPHNRSKGSPDSGCTSPLSSSSKSSPQESLVPDPAVDSLGDETSQLTFRRPRPWFYLLQENVKTEDSFDSLRSFIQEPSNQENSEDRADLLPSGPVFEHLLEVYFTFVNPFFPLLHKAHFYGELRKSVHGVSKLLLNSIFALASNLSREREWLHKENARFEVFYSRAKQLLNESYDVTSLSNVQALVLLSICFRITHGGIKSWIYSGMAIRLAEDLGLHRNPDSWQTQRLSSEVRETRKRVWWACYILDRTASASMGRPLCIDDRHCDTNYPTIPQVELDSPQVMSDPEAGYCMKVFVQSVKLYEIIGSILNNIYAIRGTSTENPIRSESILLELDSALHTWQVSLPSSMKYEPSEYFAGIPPAAPLVAYIHILYHNALILLHRPYIPKPKPKVLPSPYPSLHICTTSANSITAIAGACHGKPECEEFLVLVLFPMFTSSTVHLINATSNDPWLRKSAKKSLSKNLKILEMVRGRWGSAGKYYVVLKSLLDARGMQLDDDEVTQPSPVLANGASNPLPGNNQFPLGQATGSMGDAGVSPLQMSDNMYPPRMSSEFPNQVPMAFAPNAQPGAIPTTISPLGPYSISTAGFNPIVPTNTITEMSANSQSGFAQVLNNSNPQGNFLPIWNVPLSFDFDEWNEYVGQYDGGMDVRFPGNPELAGEKSGENVPLNRNHVPVPVPVNTNESIPANVPNFYSNLKANQPTFNLMKHQA